MKGGGCYDCDLISKYKNELEAGLSARRKTNEVLLK